MKTSASSSRTSKRRRGEPRGSSSHQAFVTQHREARLRGFFVRRVTLVLIACCLIALFLPQCKGEAYLGVSREELDRKLASGDYAFIDKIDARSPPGAEVLSYAPGAGYCFGLAARERGRLDLFARLLEIEVTSGTAPFKHRAAKELLEYLNDSRGYEKAEALAESYLAAHPDSPFRDRARMALVESFYWRKDDREVLARIEEYFQGTAAVLRSVDPELFLFKAVSSCRLGLQGWEALVREFFLTVRASSLHVRLYSFLEQEKEKLAAFPPFERDLFKAIGAAGDGRNPEAAALFERLLPQLPALSGTALAADFTAAALSGGPTARRAAILAAFARKAAGEEKAALFESAGRVYLAAKNRANARACQEAALAATGDRALATRAVYRLIRLGLDGGAEAGLAAFKTWGPRIVDIYYFADAQDELLNLLMRERKYARLLELASSPPAWLVPEEKASLAYIAARLLSENLVPAGADKQAAIAAHFKAARAGSPRGYYRLLAAHFLNDRTAAEAIFDTRAPNAPAPRPASFNDAELLADAFLAFGLYRRAFALFGEAGTGIRDEALAHWADRLSRRERPYEAIQTLSVLVARSPASPNALSRSQLGILYPRAFAALIAPAAENFKLDEHLFFSLVRQESAFNPGIASSAGAVGLTQLMPETGEWIALQLKAGKADLAEPATNVRFGAYYLSHLTGRLETVPYVLAGYNAGPNASRRWRLKYGRLPADLAVEAFDYAETRGFIKSIFSGHVIYNLLYKNAGIKESARLFYNF